MTIFRTSNTDPYFNLASEEYLIDNMKGDIFMLWINAPVVVIGRNQNAYAELDRGFIEEHGIKVVRRLSGGGAVFHDLGNVNFTFIVDDDGSDIDFSRFTSPVTAALASLGIEAELSGRNDIVSKGVKISGNAQARRSGRIMHHGTLLYSADLSHMSGALNVNDAKLKSKGVKSIRARVGNLKQLYELSLDADGFKATIEEYAEKSWPDAVIRPFTEEENAAIQRLADEKYSRWEWNWGQSKQFEASVTKYFPFGLLRIDYSLSGGYVSDIEISGDFFGRKDIREIEERLRGLRFTRETVEAAVSDIGEYISGASAVEFAGMLF